MAQAAKAERDRLKAHADSADLRLTDLIMGTEIAVRGHPNLYTSYPYLDAQPREFSLHERQQKLKILLLQYHNGGRWKLEFLRPPQGRNEQV